MNITKYKIKLYNEGDQKIAECLEWNLAVQAETMEQAIYELKRAIVSKMAIDLNYQYQLNQIACLSN